MRANTEPGQGSPQETSTAGSSTTNTVKTGCDRLCNWICCREEKQTDSDLSNRDLLRMFEEQIGELRNDFLHNSHSSSRNVRFSMDETFPKTFRGENLSLMPEMPVSISLRLDHLLFFY